MAVACSGFVAAAFLVATLRFLVFAARLRAAFNFRVRIPFFAADLLILGIGFAPVIQSHDLALGSYVVLCSLRGRTLHRDLAANTISLFASGHNVRGADARLRLAPSYSTHLNR